MAIDGSSSFRFMRLAPEHAALVYALELRCFALPWSEAQCRAALAQPAFAAFGLFYGEDLIGYISVYHAAGELEILNLGVIPEKRRQGFGRRILTSALQAARKMGMQKALLEVRPSNTAAIALYESCGFQQAGIRPHYYTDTGEDALILCNDFQSDAE